MKNYQDFFKGKKITMLGLGLLGRGLNDARFLAESGADLTITDLKTAEQLKPTLKKLEKYPPDRMSTSVIRAGKNIKYVLGEHRLEDFKNQDFILKAAGIPLDSPYIAEARKNNIPIKMDASWLVELAPEIIVIGITGTRGKSTTTHLIYHILKLAEDKFLPNKVYLGGNVKGLATLPYLSKIKKGDILLMELDSWQLQGFGEAGISPHISVFTNLLPDHLNYYLKGSKDEVEAEQKYFEDKAKIYLNQKSEDYLICGEKISKRIGKIKSYKIVANKEMVPKSWKVKIPGEHNLENIACAIKACEAFNVPLNIIKKGVESFIGVEGRLELIREYKGIKIYNDTTATTPGATVMALRALGNKDKKIVLISGGADKNLDMSGLIKEIPKFCKETFFLSGSGTEKLKNDFSKQMKDMSDFKNLKEAVMVAIKMCKKGDILLFSPAFASFGMFKNEYDRGDKFVQIIKKLK
jgi:UDP-N-acetylmuramoylalanine--D-glutamate ligase